MSTPPSGRALTFRSVVRTDRGLIASALPVATPTDRRSCDACKRPTPMRSRFLFDRYAPGFQNSRGVIRDSGEAETWCKSFFHLYKKSSLFDGSKGTAKNWILQIALHRALDGKPTWLAEDFILVQILAHSAIHAREHRPRSGNRFET